MLGYTSLLKVYGVAVNSFKRVMNTFEYKDKIISGIMEKLGVKSVDFMGSFMFFDPAQETHFKKCYTDEDGTPTTDAFTYKNILEKMCEKLKLFKKSEKEYSWCCLGTIIRDNDISHHLSFLFKKTGNAICVKMFNPGLFYLPSRYGDLTKQLLKEAIELIGCTHRIFEQKMTQSLCQSYNPQDICKGGIFDHLLSFVHYKYAIQNESYCQTWCILMMIHELNQLGDDYCFEENYIQNWSSHKQTLEISIREFILWIVRTFDKVIPFSCDFSNELNELGCVYKRESFNSTLLKTFQTLHPGVKTPTLKNYLKTI